MNNLSSKCEFGLILYKLVDGIQSEKIQDTLLRKGVDLSLKKAIDVCRADEATNYEMKIIKQEIDVDGVQRNSRRSNNDNRGKMQHTARAVTSTTTNNQKKCKYCGKQHLPKQCLAFGQVQNKVKKVRNKEEQANEKMKKNKQQLDDDGSMDKNKEKLYDDRTAINKKQQVDSMTRDYDAQKKEATLVMKMNNKNVRIKLTGAEVNVMPT